MRAIQGALMLFTQAVVLVTGSAISINTESQLQLIDGFGVSQAFGRAKEFQDANTTVQKQALDLLFSTNAGAGFSIIRNLIPSSSDATIEPNSPGSPSNPPTYRWDGSDLGQVWFTTQAARYGVKTIYADAWSAPGFMKTSGNEATPGYLCGTPGHNCSTGDWRQAYANYLVQYVKYYQKAGLNITHLGFLNEPDWTTDYSQTQISDNAADAISFIPILFDTVKEAGLNVEITCCDATGWPKQTTYTDALVSAGMERYLGIMTSHAYGGDADSPLDTTLRTWLTEAGAGDYAFTTTWYNNGAINEGMTWANKIAMGIVQADLSAYVYWEGFEIDQQQSYSHLLDVDGITGDVFGSGAFHAFTMWSRFIRPGAHRVSTAGSLSGVTIGAFLNPDSSVVAVLTNNGPMTQTVQISVPSGKTSASAWLTDNDHQVASTAVRVANGTVAVPVTSHGVVTVKFT
ncbi:glycoside hydrolase superfamily [Aspergillus lucknowensis]|uniref:Glycoside hydrolase superfamily n=1 Tax=Aspergillus lucknowensis TaxID=176173 RepID=A0ABR4LHU7_9EURO